MNYLQTSTNTSDLLAILDYLAHVENAHHNGDFYGRLARFASDLRESRSDALMDTEHLRHRAILFLANINAGYKEAGDPNPRFVVPVLFSWDYDEGAGGRPMAYVSLGALSDEDYAALSGAVMSLSEIAAHESVPEARKEARRRVKAALGRPLLDVTPHHIAREYNTARMVWGRANAA